MKSLNDESGRADGWIGRKKLAYDTIPGRENGRAEERWNNFIDFSTDHARANARFLHHSGLGRMGTATFDFVGDFDRDFDTFVPKYGNKYQLEGRNPDLDEKKH